MDRAETLVPFRYSIHNSQDPPILPGDYGPWGRSIACRCRQHSCGWRQGRHSSCPAVGTRCSRARCAPGVRHRIPRCDQGGVEATVLEGRHSQCRNMKSYCSKSLVIITSRTFSQAACGSKVRPGRRRPVVSPRNSGSFIFSSILSINCL